MLVKRTMSRASMLELASVLERISQDIRRRLAG
jgi:hypothetical protein